MITCTVCSFQNLDDDSFCGSCGGFLEWTGEADIAEAAPVEQADDGPKRSLLSRVQTALSLDVHAPGEDEIEADDAAAPGGPPRPGGPPKPGGPPRPGGPPKARGRTQAASTTRWRTHTTEAAR